MGPQDTKRVVQEFYRAVDAGNTDAVLNLLAEDVEWTVPGAAPFAGRRRGRDDVRRFFSARERLAVVEDFDLRELIAQDDQVVAFGEERLRARDSGSHVEQHWAHAFTIRDGKIAAVQFFEDTAGIQAAFGESPAERRAQLGPMGVTEPAFSGERAWEEITRENRSKR